MNLHPARRSAERFDALVEGDWHDAVDPRTAELLELVGAVRSIAAPAARPEFVADLRERLMLAAESELVVPDSSKDLDRRLTVAPRRTPRDRRLAIALGGFAIVGATTSMAVAAQSALPGDALYPVKRAIENAESGFRVSDDAKGQTILANASGRLDEVDKLTSQGNADATDIEQTLDTFSVQAAEAGDLLLADYEHTGREDSISELRNFTADSIATLSSLENVIPAQAEAALLNAAKVVFTIDAAAATACPTCAGKGISEIPTQLLASGGQDLDDAAVALAGAALAASAQSNPKPNKPGKGDEPATVDESDTPVDVPSASADAPDGSTGQGQPNGVDVNVGNGGGGKKDKNKPIDLGPVNDAVDEVVEGVNDVIGGLGAGGNNKKKN